MSESNLSARKIFLMTTFMVFGTFIRLIFGTQIEIQLAASASRPCCSRTAGPLGLISGFSTRKTDNWKPSVVVTLSSRHEYPWSLIISGTDKWLSSGISFSIVKLNSVAELTLNRVHSEVILVQKSGYFRWKIKCEFFLSVMCDMSHIIWLIWGTRWEIFIFRLNSENFFLEFQHFHAKNCHDFPKKLKWRIEVQNRDSKILGIHPRYKKLSGGF